jgi:hypothetical protein
MATGAVDELQGSLHHSGVFKFLLGRCFHVVVRRVKIAKPGRIAAPENLTTLRITTVPGRFSGHQLNLTLA